MPRRPAKAAPKGSRSRKAPKKPAKPTTALDAALAAVEGGEIAQNAHEEARRTLSLIERAARERWQIPEQAEAVPKRVAAIALASKDERTAVAASRVLVQMRAHNLHLEVEAEKQRRLDAGLITDRVEHVLPPQAEAAVGEILEAVRRGVSG